MSDFSKAFKEAVESRQGKDDVVLTVLMDFIKASMNLGKEISTRGMNGEKLTDLEKDFVSNIALFGMTMMHENIRRRNGG
jgi:hypothetical protein